MLPINSERALQFQELPKLLHLWIRRNLIGVLVHSILILIHRFLRLCSSYCTRFTFCFAVNFDINRMRSRWWLHKIQAQQTGMQSILSSRDSVACRLPRWTEWSLLFLFSLLSRFFFMFLASVYICLFSFNDYYCERCLFVWESVIAMKMPKLPLLRFGIEENCWQNRTIKS